MKFRLSDGMSFSSCEVTLPPSCFEVVSTSGDSRGDGDLLLDAADLELHVDRLGLADLDAHAAALDTS